MTSGPVVWNQRKSVINMLHLNEQESTEQTIGELYSPNIFVGLNYCQQVILVLCIISFTDLPVKNDITAPLDICTRLHYQTDISIQLELSRQDSVEVFNMEATITNSNCR